MHQLTKLTQSQTTKLTANATYENYCFDELSLVHRDLTDCQFTHCTFVSANLTGVRCNNSIFTDCNLSNAQIRGANFFSSTFEKCKLLGVALSHAESIIAAQFRQCVFDYGDLSRLDLSKQDLSFSSFAETNFALCNLERTLFVNCNLANARFDGARFSMTDMRGATLQNLSLKETNLRGIIITPKQLEELAAEIGITVLESN